jgi:hypothetical protein
MIPVQVYTYDEYKQYQTIKVGIMLILLSQNCQIGTTNLNLKPNDIKFLN